MKCSQCGSTKFHLLPALTNEGAKMSNMEAHACLKCGHIEWTLPEGGLEKLKDKIEQDKQQNKVYKQADARREKLNERKKELKAIIRDEKASTRAVNVAKEEIIKIDMELQSLPTPPKKPTNW